jgi:hypothetical protein
MDSKMLDKISRIILSGFAVLILMILFFIALKMDKYNSKKEKIYEDNKNQITRIL